MLIGIISRAAALRDGVAQIRHAQLYRSVAAHHSGKERVRGARPAVLRFHKRRQQRFGVTGNARAAHRRFHAQIRVLLRAQNDRIRRKALSGRDGFARRAAVLLRSMILQPEDLKRTDDEKVRLLLCEICDRLYHEDGRRGISRESLDGYDVSYTDDAGACEIRQLVRQSLGADGVLYRGRRL